VRVAEFLGAARDGDGWVFDLPERLHGAYGGAFGGVVAACALVAARSLVDERDPVALDCRFLRGIPAGTVRATPTLLHEGRSLQAAAVELSSDGRRRAHACISFVDRSVLDAFELQVPPAPPFESYDDARPWPAVAPIASTLDVRSVGSFDGGDATALRVPWDGSSAEAACLAGDMSVGAPVARGVSGTGITHPNPDLSLRFCGEVATPVVVGHARMERAGIGVGAVRISVWSGETLVAIGSSVSLLLPSRG